MVALYLRKCFNLPCMFARSFWGYSLQSNRVKRTPQDAINEFIIPKFNPLVDIKIQIHLCSLACVMSREFTREAVIKFLPPQFPWIWRKCLRSNFIHSKIFNLTKYREVLVKYLLLITHVGMPIWIWHQLREQINLVPRAFPLKGKALGTRLGNKSMTPIVLCDCCSNLHLCFKNRTKYQPKHRQDCDHDSLY